MYARIILKTGKEKSVLKRHPWIYADSVKNIENYKKTGQVCEIYSSNKKKLATGFCNKKTSIICRIVSFSSNNINIDLIKKRIDNAFLLRKDFINDKNNSYRLINAEGDYFPGLIIDVYKNILCCQFQNAGIDNLKKEIINILIEKFNPKAIIERADQPHRKKEGLKQFKKVIYGKTDGIVEINENGCKFLVDIINGQKTGFFLDQKENRKLLGEYSKNKTILNCFCYTGGFSVYALKNKAKKVVSVDIAGPAIQYTKKNLELNNLCSDNVLKANVFEYLRKNNEKFDIVILDPPRFASTKKELKNALKGYKDINRLAFNKIKKGGFLFSFSCSRAVDQNSFFNIVKESSFSKNRNIQIIKKLFANFDHPKSIYHNESEYLKGFICRVC